MARNFSFFIRSGHSGKIRAKQIGEYLGNARIQPASDFAEDICIYVKIRPPRDYPSHTYVDVMDEPWVLPWIRKHPTINLIAISETCQEYLAKELHRDDIVLIKENHCNYDRVVKPRGEIKTVGVIGGPNAFQYSHEEFAEKMAALGMEFVHYREYDNRRDVINFYDKIDIQVVWRQWLNFPELNNPLKLANACSYGIPTVAYPEVSYAKEFSDYFVAVKTIDDMVAQVKRLKEDAGWYNELAARGVEKAEEYHIENIAKEYRKLAEKDVYVPPAPVIINQTNSPAELGISVKLRALLLDKEVDIFNVATGTWDTIPVYGLSHFRVSPRRCGIGRQLCKGFESTATRNGKKCVVAFCDEGVLDFYTRVVGWYDCGTFDMYGNKHIVSSIPLGRISTKEEW